MSDWPLQGIVTILFIECISYLNYSKIKKVKNLKVQFCFNKFHLNFKNLFIIQSFNFYKIGLLLGFFTDAFKVGS